MSPALSVAGRGKSFEAAATEEDTDKEDEEGKREDAVSPSRSWCCAVAVEGALKTAATWAL